MKPVVDLSLCDTEPIHIIGSVQPHGALLAVDPPTLVVTHASANIGSYLGRTPEALFGRTLPDIVGEASAAAILSRAMPPSFPELLRPCFLAVVSPGGDPVEVEVFPHSHDGRIILEMVARENAPAAVWEEDLLRQRIITELIRPESLEDLARAGADIIREVTGFDRVMIYRFAPDKHGEVIAESTVRPDSFLGLHYPASDIPDPARRHFVLNVIRSIPDINAAPVPILAKGGSMADASDRPLDLTFSKLRGVAPVHIEYLNNMGVGASLSISLISNAKLWGLVACHHYAPLRLSWSRMRFCELVGGTVSALLQSLENATQLQRSIRAEKIAFDIERKARSGSPLRRVIEDHAEAILDMTASTGMIVSLDRHTILRGEVPQPAPDHARLAAGSVDGVATTDHLAGLGRKKSASTAAGASGAAFLELAPDSQDYLLLLRPEFDDEIRWAGKPEKLEVRLDDGRVRLSPRGSFALWREERKGRSKPFSDSDGEVLRILRRALFALNSLDRERAAVKAQIEAEAEEAKLRLMLLDASRDRALGEMASALAHELNQPLSAVVNYVNACRQELRNYQIPASAGLGGLMDSAVFEATRAADLVRRLRNFITHGEIDLTRFDITSIIRQSVNLALAAAKERAPAVGFDFDETNRFVWADPVQVSQVILNLVRNGMSASGGQGQPALVISTRCDDGLLEVSVRDNGPGVGEEMRHILFEPFHRSTTSGMGIGLSLCRSIVEAHGGRIWFRDSPSGADIAFTLQLAEGADDKRS